ncbi:hypothetical protein LTR97_002219 [Elasticomyces elasticus]|uniref:Peptidase A1 domain-containing protein n=1 Tax=Elasticomyces elasticus TaxID=574655 RepID=A0AAN7VV39_9PEZI|nr:hypothetical protein LTR97_002219 [Elasticomyces elasticus]
MAEGTATIVAAPLSWSPSSFWDGNDGLWNTFLVDVGTPPQQFRVLPSTAGQETWLPNPQGCTTANPDDPGYCGYLRGALPFNGANSSGFFNNESSSWDLIGLYTLDAQEAELGYTGNGLYGFDTVALNGTTTPFSENKSVVAGVADLDYWLGVFGLGPKAINFTTFNDPIPNYMRTLVDNNTIPSLSWGYTAGAFYRDQAPASLILGGFDANRISGANLTIEMNGDNSRPLQVAITKIFGENTLGGAGIDLLPAATYHFIDSTLPHIWLPDDAIQLFVDNFGLTYDNDTDLFLINDTMRELMLSNNPTVTFVLGTSKSAAQNETLNIALPYAAFDLQASYPFYQNATNYFPIRRAANSSQYTIGRTFLQEAYLTADWDRNNFTVAQASFFNLDTQHIVAIDKYVAPPESTSTVPASKPPKPSDGISGGAIAGIVVAAIVGIALVGLGIWFMMRRNRKHQPLPTSDHENPDTAIPMGAYSDDKKDASNVRGSELPSEHALVEAPGNEKRPSELASPYMPALEMEGDAGKARARSGMVEMPASTDRNDGVRYELHGSEPGNDLRT